MTVFSKNSILAGCVDYYCLACDTQLRTDEDAFQHIAKPIHKKNLDATSFLDKHKDDHVRKVKKGYFCEYCNVFMRTAAKVGPHVAETAHRENKSVRPLRREGNGVIAFDSVFISENAWHGFIDDTCAVCDAEFANAQIHKTDTWHALNLVLLDIEIGEGNNVYRKVDESTFQCLTCNMVCAQKTMSEHFKESEHMKLYQQCCVSGKTMTNGKQDIVGTVKDDNETKSPAKDGVTEKKIEEKQKTVENGLAKDNKCNKSPEHELSKKNTRKLSEKEAAKEETKIPEVEKKNDKKTEAPKEPERKETKNMAGVEKKEDKKLDNDGKDVLGKTDKDICKGLGAVNYITRDASGMQWCIICDWSMDDNVVKCHLESRHHHAMLKMHKERQAKNQNGEPENENLNENKSKISDSATEFQKNDIKLDLIANCAYCRKCSTNIDFDFDVILDHIDEHKKAAKPKDKTEVKEVQPFPTGSETKSSTNLYTAPVHKNDPKPKPERRESRDSSVSSTREEDEVDAFAKLHNLTYTMGNKNVFCRLCIIKVPASIRNLKEHINGITHKSKIAKTAVKSTVNAPTMTPSHAFVKDVVTIENMFSKDIVINEKYVVNILSFLMITKNGSKLRCQACEVNVARSEIDKHKNTPKHERTMNDALVASSEDSEFIREIRENLFHCGFCNQLEATWATMDAHLKSTAHREAKTAASWRMMEYRPKIAQHKMRQRMHFDLLTRMLLGQMFGDDSDD